MASRIDVAIVGGGAVGWSCAWHLLRAAPGLKVSVFDPDPSRCTSLRGAGGFRAQFSSPINIAMSLASIPELMRFAAETGTDVGARQNGYLLLTGDPARAAGLRELGTIQRNHGVRTREVGLDEVARSIPSVNPEGLIYAQLGLQDGFLDGPGVRNGYRAAALALGAAEVSEGVRSVDGDRLETDAATHEARHVVVTAGHWSGEVCRKLPIRSEKHQLYFVPGKLPESTPFVIDLDTTFHYRPHGEQALVCYNDPELAAQSFAPEDLPEFDPTVLDRLLPLAEFRAPGLMSDKPVTGRAGFYGVTPDRHPALGRLDGVIVATGFGGHGVMHSPAAGIAVSEMVLQGESRTLDIKALSPDRFAKGQLLAESWVF